MIVDISHPHLDKHVSLSGGLQVGARREGGVASLRNSLRVNVVNVADDAIAVRLYRLARPFRLVVDDGPLIRVVRVAMAEMAERNVEYLAVRVSGDTSLERSMDCENDVVQAMETDGFFVLDVRAHQDTLRQTRPLYPLYLAHLLRGTEPRLHNCRPVPLSSGSVLYPYPSRFRDRSLASLFYTYSVMFVVYLIVFYNEMEQEICSFATWLMIHAFAMSITIFGGHGTNGRWVSLLQYQKHSWCGCQGGINETRTRW